MSIWTFPVQVHLENPPSTASEAQKIAAAIEEAVEEALEDADLLARGTMEPLVVCGQPGEGFLRHMSLDKSA
jgi:hypothetical protein